VSDKNSVLATSVPESLAQEVSELDLPELKHFLSSAASKLRERASTDMKHQNPDLFQRIQEHATKLDSLAYSIGISIDLYSH